MAEKQDNPSERTVSGGELKNGTFPADSTVASMDARRSGPDDSAPKSGFVRMLGAVNSFLNSMDEKVPKQTPSAAFFHGAVFCSVIVLTICFMILALNYSENHRIKFYPPDEVMDYLSAEHESLEALACEMPRTDGKKTDLPLDSFDAKCVGIVKPLKIYGDEYGVYLMTGKDWCNGEHGIFIAKDAENMPADLNWGLIAGRIYTYALYN